MMNDTRFEHLLEAYGTRWNAWPQAERDAARQLLNGSTRLQTLWTEADGLDVFLDTVRAPSVTSTLREAVIASAAGAGLRARRPTRMWAWLSGAGVAATAFAGAAFGVLISYQINSPVRADDVLYQASMTVTDDTEVLGFEMASLDISGR